ncbi:MAG: DUF2461 family protein [Acidobacteriia bacterium]|nr:DUF2461 family protein [Terriglobia bacterium]
MMEPSSFAGFDRDSFQLFRDLADPVNNNKLWFDANRWRYEQHVVGRMRALLQALKPPAMRLNPHFDFSGKTNGNFSRINRDIRFSKDKSPYKLNYYLYLFDKRRSRDGDGRLYVGLSGEGLTVGFSVYGQWRRKTGDILKDVLKKRQQQQPALLEAFLRRRITAGRYQSYWYSMAGKEWTQQAGFPRKPDQWRALLGWVVRRKIGLRAACSPAVLQEIQTIFRDLFPLYLFSAAKEPSWKKRFASLTK